jgi:hypothetical protein
MRVNCLVNRQQCADCGGFLAPAAAWLSCREFKKIILLGYKFAQRMDDEGAYERFCTAGVDKKSLIL